MGNSAPSSTIVLRGYDRREVDRAVDQVLSAAGRVAEPPRLPVALRCYARNEVDAWFRSAAGSVPGAAGYADGHVRHRDVASGRARLP
jgi:hypothetical protein